MKPHGNTGKRNAAKAPEQVKSVLKSLRFTPAEIAAQDQARGSVSWAKWARERLKCWRILKADELPKVGDEVQLVGLETWQTVNIPSVWLAGGKRIKGVQFRRLLPTAAETQTQRHNNENDTR